MRVYIDTDLEGISGVTLFEQTREPGNPRYQDARRLLMGDINAAVEGALQGGATYVAVLDGHGYPLNVIPELMHAQAEYICGRGFPLGWGADQRFDCALLVGYHAMNRTRDGVLCHTQNSRSDARYWYNGREFGEIGQQALILGHYGIPVVMVTGDAAACREAREFLGDGIVTVAVKCGYGRECCRMVAPARARDLIREGARQALALASVCQPFRMDLPLHGRCERLAEPLPDGPTPADLEQRARVVKEKTFAEALDICNFA
jgi:D-amino peptidase